jgi:hypothetical protein
VYVKTTKAAVAQNFVPTRVFRAGKANRFISLKALRAPITMSSSTLSLAANLAGGANSESDDPSRPTCQLTLYRTKQSREEVGKSGDTQDPSEYLFTNGVRLKSA